MTCTTTSATSNPAQPEQGNVLSDSRVPSESDHDVTGLLLEWQSGDDGARERLISLVYGQLKRLAGGHLRGERNGHTLQPTALVNEVYLRLVDQERVQWKSRAHFFGIASHLMRRILVDHARRRQAEKRGGPEVTLSLDKALGVTVTRDVDLVCLDDALERLATFAPRPSRIIELRFFGGLTIEETAHVLDVSPATVKNDWQMAKGWLFGQLKGKE